MTTRTFKLGDEAEFVNGDWVNRVRVIGLNLTTNELVVQLSDFPNDPPITVAASDLAVMGTDSVTVSGERTTTGGVVTFGTPSARNLVQSGTGGIGAPSYIEP